MTSGDVQENLGRTNEGEKVYTNCLYQAKYIRWGENHLGIISCLLLETRLT